MPKLLKAVYKELEFSQPAEGTGPERGYAAARLPRARRRRGAAGVACRDAGGAPVAVAISKSAEGEFALDAIGLAWRPGEARAVCRRSRAVR